MIVGNKQRFAIEWEVHGEPIEGLLYGKICYWLSSAMVGDYDLGVILSDVLSSLTYTIGDARKRSSDRFCGMPSEEIFAALHSALFDSNPALVDLALQETWDRYNISLAIDVFDRWRMYLIDCDGSSRLIVGCFNSENGRYEYSFETTLDLYEFDDVVNAFTEHFNM